MSIPDDRPHGAFMGAFLSVILRRAGALCAAFAGGRSHTSAGAACSAPLRARAVAYRSRALAALVALASVALLAPPAAVQAQRAQGNALKAMGMVEGVTSLDYFCERRIMDALLGPPLGEGAPLVARPVNVYVLQFEVFSEDRKQKEALFLGIYTFDSNPGLLNLGPRILEQFNIPRSQARLKSHKTCEPVYTADEKARSSKPHSNLVRLGTVITPHGPRYQYVTQSALYLGTGKADANAAPPPPVAALPPPAAQDKAGAAPKQSKEPLKDQAKDPVRDKAVKGQSAPGAVPGAGVPGAGAQPDQGGLGRGGLARPDPQGPPAPAPKGAGPDTGGTGAPAPKLAPPVPPVVAAPAPKDVPQPQPKLDPPPAAGAQSKSLADEAAACTRGDPIACMIVSKSKARAEPPQGGPRADAGAKADPPEPKASKDMPSTSGSDPATDGQSPAPQKAEPAPPPKAAPPPVLAAPPKVSDPDAGPKQTKRYPAPAYPTLEQPLTAAAVATIGSVEAFVVESVECSDEGNWLVGFTGALKPAAGGKSTLTIDKRVAVNNYPTEGRTTREELKASPLGLNCATDGIACSVPRKRISIVEMKKLKNDEGGDPKAWLCEEDKGICFSRQSDLWRCEPGRPSCLSYDQTRWWCVPRREFCYQTVPFGDWGSPFKAGDTLNVALEPQRDAAGAAVKDANGNVVFDNHVYPLARGMIAISQDALMRRCAGYAGPARSWTSKFPTN